MPTGKDGESNFVIFAFETKHFKLKADCVRRRENPKLFFFFLMDQSFQT